MRNIRENRAILGRVVQTVCWSSVGTFLYLAHVSGPGQSISHFFGSGTVKSFVPQTFMSLFVTHLSPSDFRVCILVECFLQRESSVPGCAAL